MRRNPPISLLGEGCDAVAVLVYHHGAAAAGHDLVVVEGHIVPAHTAAL